MSISLIFIEEHNLDRTRLRFFFPILFSPARLTQGPQSELACGRVHDDPRSAGINTS